jgi:DNA-binding CsgD family transcriptional regulator
MGSWWVGVDLPGVFQTVGALRNARDGDVFVLLDGSVVGALQRVFPAARIAFIDLHAEAHQCVVLELSSLVSDHPTEDFWQHCDPPSQLSDMHTDWTAAHQDENALVMPLPAPPGKTRRLVFLPQPGRTFGDEERNAAELLQPHIADALRLQSRIAVARLLTRRQRELLRLVAAGHDNIAIASLLGLSPATVRKHLENAFSRLGVSSRTEAVAKFYADATWL